MPEATPFQVMIVDDHPLMRRGVRQLLELDPGFEVVAEAGDGASAIDLANRLDIDVILLDLNMKGMSGLDTLNALRRDGVTAQIIILTVSDASSDVFALIDAGADGYLLKDSDPEVLLEAIRAGAKGSKVFSERVNQYLRERELFGAEEDPFSVLTERELDVLHELAQGLSNKQIASVLNISEQTVKVHIRNLLRKLNQVGFVADDRYVSKLPAEGVIRLHSYEECCRSKKMFGENFTHMETESNRLEQTRAIVEPTGDKYVVINAPYAHLTPEELERILTKEN